MAYGTETDFRSGYVWRGLVVSDRPVVQPAVWFSAKPFTFVVWTNSTMSETTEGARPRVTDLILTYEHNWRGLRVEPAIEAYLYRDALSGEASNSMEGSLRLSYPIDPLRVFTVHTLDFLAYRGAYFGEAGVSYERPVTEKTEIGVSFHSGWASSRFNDAYIGLEKPALNFIGVESSLMYYVKRYLYLRPHLELSNIIDRQLHDELLQPTFFSVGLALGVEF